MRVFATSQVDIIKKYNNFLVPRYKIIVNNEDLFEKYGIQASAITVEEEIGIFPKFIFSMNDLQLLQISTGLLKLSNSVTIKMGYANTLETIVEGEIKAVKSIFPSKMGHHELKFPDKQYPVAILIPRQTITLFLPLRTAKRYLISLPSHAIKNKTIKFHQPPENTLLKNQKIICIASGNSRCS